MSDPADLSPNPPPSIHPPSIHPPSVQPLADPFASGADALRVEGLGSANGSTEASVTAGANGTASVNGHGALNGAGALAPEPADAVSPSAPRAGNVIDLRDAGTTRVRVAKDNNPFSTLSKQERMRLIVRVLCEIVAYGELEDSERELPVEKIDTPPVAPAPLATDVPISNN